MNPVTNNSTTRLYWADAYQQEASARVLGIDETRLVLDATVFHAHGGGQPGDIGTIAGAKVSDTRKSDDPELIVHHLEQPADLNIGDEVQMKIDWARRYGLMRHHTALHLVHLAVQHVIGELAPGGTQVSEDKARIEYPIREGLDLAAIEDAVRQMVGADLPATTEFGQDGIRRWAIPGWPAIPCGGTHVARVSELDAVALRAKSAGKRGTRIYVTSTLAPFTF